MSKKKQEASQRNNSSDKKGEDTNPKPISNRAELKTFLTNVRDRLAESAAPPIHCITAMRHALNLPNVYELLDQENKEIARDIWLRIRQHGMHVRVPPILFAEGEQLESQG